MAVKLDRKQNDIEVAFHTIMRKYLDSKASSICYNIIHVLEDEWPEFIKKISDKEINRKSCLDAVPLGQTCALNLFHIGLEMLNDEEYKILNREIKEMLKLEYNKDDKN